VTEEQKTSHSAGDKRGVPSSGKASSNILIIREDDFLHHHVLVPLELGIRRQTVWIDLHDLFPVDGNTVYLAAFRPPLGGTPFVFRGVVRTGQLWLVRLDRRPALLALEPVDLVAQALVLCLGHPQVRHDIFQQIEQLPDELASPVIRNAVQIKVFKHVVRWLQGREIARIKSY
jgi:hypothetical protein